MQLKAQLKRISRKEFLRKKLGALEIEMRSISPSA